MPKRLSKIPVKLIDGHWVALDGSRLNVTADASAVLVIDPKFIDAAVLLPRKPRNRDSHRVFLPGTTLMVALAINVPDMVPPALSRHLLLTEQIPGMGRKYAGEAWGSRDFQFVPIRIVEGDHYGRWRRGKEPGLWLHIDRGEAKDMKVSGLAVPPEVSETPLESLNQAFTRLSMAYEPWRKSHTGNAYTRMLYQEADGTWFPLDDLRTAGPESNDHPLAQKLWLQILSAESATETSNRR